MDYHLLVYHPQPNATMLSYLVQVIFDLIVIPTRLTMWCEYRCRRWDSNLRPQSYMITALIVLLRHCATPITRSMIKSLGNEDQPCRCTLSLILQTAPNEPVSCDDRRKKSNLPAKSILSIYITNHAEGQGWCHVSNFMQTVSMVMRYWRWW